MNSNLALFADSPTAACWRRRRSLLKYLVLPLQPLVLALEPAQVLGHLERVLAARGVGRVGLLDPVREASRVASEPARHLDVGGARLSVKLNGLLLELGRVLGRWGPMPAPNPPLSASCGTEIDLSTGMGQIQAAPEVTL